MGGSGAWEASLEAWVLGLVLQPFRVRRFSLTSLLPSSVTLGKWLHLSDSQSPHFSNEDGNSGLTDCYGC